MVVDFLTLSSKIAEVVAESKSQELIFFKRTKQSRTSKYEAFNFEFDKNSISDSLKSVVINNINRNSGNRLTDYTINLETNSKNVIYELSANDVINLKKIFAGINEPDGRMIVGNMKDINPNFYVINFEKDENQVVAFAHHSPVTTFKGKILMNWQSQIYKDCLSIKENVDCLYYRLKLDNDIFENLVIFQNSKTQFENIFDYKEEYWMKAKDSIEKIKQHKLIDNMEFFTRITMNDEFMIKKLAKINLENKINLILSKFENVVKANNDLEELKVDIDEVNKIIKIPYNADKSYIEKILSLLNTEPMQNLITEDKLLLSDNNIIQQKLAFS